MPANYFLNTSGVACCTTGKFPYFIRKTILVSQRKGGSSFFPVQQKKKNHENSSDGCGYTCAYTYHLEPLLGHISRSKLLVINSTKQNPSWELINSPSAGQEFPYILWNPKPHFRFHNIKAHAPISICMNTIHILTFFSCKFHFEIIIS
jgi:hypothetical protein